MKQCLLPMGPACHRCLPHGRLCNLYLLVSFLPKPPFLPTNPTLHAHGRAVKLIGDDQPFHEVLRLDSGLRMAANVQSVVIPLEVAAVFAEKWSWLVHHSTLAHVA